MSKFWGGAVLAFFLQCANAKDKYDAWLNERLGLKYKPWYDEPDVDHTSEEWLIWALSTTAPSFIGKYATIVGPGMPGKILRNGTNGWTCVPCNAKGMPEGGFPTAHQVLPLCGDAQVFLWITAYIKGEKPVMDKDGWAWMLHGDLGEDNTEGGHSDDLAYAKKHKDVWIESGPHLMLVPMKPEAMTTENDFGEGAPYTMFAGTDYAHVMIPVEGYYRYEKQHNEIEKTSSAESAKLAEVYEDSAAKDGIKGHAEEATRLFTASGNPLIKDNAPTPMGGAVMALACLASLSLGMVVTRITSRSTVAAGATLSEDEESIFPREEFPREETGASSAMRGS